MYSYSIPCIVHKYFEIQSQMFVDTCLPAGPLGLELEPAVKTARCSIGCKVRRWRMESPFASLVVPGCTFIQIDDKNVETMEFREVVQFLKNSSSRKVLMKKVSQQPSSMPSQKNMSICFNLEEPEECEFASNKTFCVAELFGSPNLPTKSKYVHSEILSEVIAYEGEENESPSECSEPIIDAQAQEQTHKDAHVQEPSESEELSRLRNDVAVLKSSARSTDGAISLLKFRIEKMRKNNISTVTEQSSMLQAADGRSLLVHWGRMRSVLNDIEGFVKRQSTEEVDGLKKSLEIEKKLTKRLEAQMRCWVDGQITLHKQLAVVHELEIIQPQSKPSSTSTACNSVLCNESANSTVFLSVTETTSCTPTNEIKATPILQKLLNGPSILPSTDGHFSDNKENIDKKMYNIPNNFMGKILGVSEKKSTAKTLANVTKTANELTKSPSRDHLVKQVSQKKEPSTSSSTVPMSPFTFREELSRLHKENSMIRDDISKFRGTLSRVREEFARPLRNHPLR
jgi:hypothetical protein